MANSDPGKAGKSEEATFFERHGRLISVLGASIVLATYLVKDELRDRAKDAADAADQNLTTYQLRSDIHQIDERLLTLQNNEMNHYHDLQTNGSNETPGQKAQAAFTDLRRQINDAAQGKYAEASAAASILNAFNPQYGQAVNAAIDKCKNQFAPIEIRVLTIPTCSSILKPLTASTTRWINTES